jgi:hypothetical protein
MTISLWLFVVAIGPVLLLAVLYWALWRNRSDRTGDSLRRSEEGARQLRREIANDPRYREK